MRFRLDIRKHFFTERIVKQLEQASLSGDIQDPPRRGPVQPAVGDPALAGGLD